MASQSKQDSSSKFADSLASLTAEFTEARGAGAATRPDPASLSDTALIAALTEAVTTYKAGKGKASELTGKAVNSNRAQLASLTRWIKSLQAEASSRVAAGDSGNTDSEQ